MYYNPFKVARAVQLWLPERSTWGGSRSGAGRKLAPGRRPSVPHRSRPAHLPSLPVHVTLRARFGGLRAPRTFESVRVSLARASRRGFRVVEFSVQDDHLHLIIEADGELALRSGIRGLAIRVALAVNRALGRRGPIWGDRYHARALITPRAVRNALVYVLMNAHKHRRIRVALDPCSSAVWFNGWRQSVGPAPGRAPTTPARTWLASVGWRRHGLIAFDERPGTRASADRPRDSS